MEILTNDIKFSTGKTLSCNCGIVGINGQDDVVSGGYDDTVWRKPHNAYPEAYEDYIKYENGLTEEELIELAEFMINRWIEFKKEIPKHYKIFKENEK